MCVRAEGNRVDDISLYVVAIVVDEIGNYLERLPLCIFHFGMSVDRHLMATGYSSTTPSRCRQSCRLR